MTKPTPNQLEQKGVKQWICDSPIFCKGNISNNLKRDKCRNCGLKKNDGRKTKPMRYEYIQ